MNETAAAKTLRLFLAVDPNPETIAQFDRTISQLRRLVPKARWVHAEKLHVTLVFLGEVENTKVSAIQGIMQSVVPLHAPFALQFAEGGTFGEKKRPRVLWAGIGGELAPLRALQKDLAERLEPLGSPPEHREYSPHLTLARSADPRGDEHLCDCLDKLRGQTFGETVVREVVLYESVQNARGSMYSALVRAPLRV